MNFFKKILKSIAKASLPVFSFDENELKFQIDSNEMLSYPLDNFDFKTRHDPYTVEAYTIKNQELFLEHIRLDNDCIWNTDAFGAYKSFFKDKLKLKSMQLVEEHNFDNYTFSTYKIDNQFFIHLIHIYEMHKDTFIVDSKGKLYTKLLTALKGQFTYEYANEEKGDIHFEMSLTKENAFASYFRHLGS
jgi:hypothetical protein